MCGGGGGGVGAGNGGDLRYLDLKSRKKFKFRGGGERREITGEQLVILTTFLSEQSVLWITHSLLCGN